MWNWTVSTNSESSLLNHNFFTAGWKELQRQYHTVSIKKFCSKAFWESQMRAESIERDMSC